MATSVKISSPIADAVRRNRSRQRKTQEDVARALGIPLSTYRNWETGRTTPGGDDLLRLARELDLDLMALMKQIR